MSSRTKPRRRLLLESLEPRFTMDAQPSGAAAMPADVQDVEQSLNQFALDLYKTISDSNSNPTGEAISPFSIAAALAMTYAGASGETAAQLAHALHFDLPPDRFHAAVEKILQTILPAASDTTTQLEIADALWGQDGFPFLDSFRQLIDDRYGGDFHEADFAHDPDAATAAVNDWVKTQTHDMIKKLFDSPLSPQTRFVLANALYFKSSWASPFPSYATQRTLFHLAGGSAIDVAMMHQGGYFNYTETGDYQIAESPYQGGRYSMAILLPKQADADLDVNFSASDLQTWLASLHSADLAVALPKFKLETSLDLIDTLQSLGITDAFDGSADFSAIDGKRDLFISKVVHKAVVEVDETGTKAAAATGIGGMTGACMCSPPAPIPFYADHPFHFLILDHQTNSVLFEGQVQHPTAYDGTDQTPVDLPRLSSIGPPIITFLPPPRLVTPVTTNPDNPFDVNADGEETPLDVLLVVNYLNGLPFPSAALRTTALATGAIIYPDVDHDGYAAPHDALLLINRWNGQINPVAFSLTALDIAPQGAEGEPASASDQLHSASAVDALLTLGDLAILSNRSAARRTA